MLDQVLFKLSTLSPPERRAFIQKLRDPKVVFSKEEDPYGATALLREMVLQILDLVEPYLTLKREWRAKIFCNILGLKKIFQSPYVPKVRRTDWENRFETNSLRQLSHFHSRF